MTKLEELLFEREKLTKEIDEILRAEQQASLEVAKQYVGRCFSYKDDEAIKIVGVRAYGAVMFDVLLLSKSYVDGYVLWYGSYEFSSIVGNKNWKEIPTFEFVKAANAEVQKILED